MTSAETPISLRFNSLSSAFEDVITVIVRVRYRTQRVADAAAFSDSARKMVAAAATEARRLGYSDSTVQMALYAIVAFLDESVLNSHDPTFADWARRPLQQQLFGNAFAGEYFFRHVSELLQQPETAERADALELHAICLLLGFRGKFAFGDSGEVYNLLRQIRERVERVRGGFTLCRVAKGAPVPAAPAGDPWGRRLLFTTAILVILCLLAFAGYWFVLGGKLSGIALVPDETPHLMTASLHSPGLRGGWLG